MALIFSIETATTVCSVSLAKDGQIIAYKELNSGYSHAENLTLFIQEVITEAKCSFAEIDAIAISKGPGSYTGLRIGVSTAKGLCYALNKPLIAIDTLQHFALAVSNNSQYNVDTEILYCPMIDARRMEVYCGIFDNLNKLVQPISAEIITEQSFSGLLSTKKIVFFGNGTEKCKPVFAHISNALFIDNITLSATHMNLLAERNFNENQFVDVAYFEPYYLKDFMLKKATF
jgi:tRNA threonylcarbamoyladenosine biosynthesis protein TsaB